MPTSEASLSHHLSVVLLDIAIGSLGKILVVMELVAEKGRAQGSLHFALPSLGVLPPGKPDLADGAGGSVVVPYSHL